MHFLQPMPDFDIGSDDVQLQASLLEFGDQGDVERTAQVLLGATPSQ